VRLAQRFREIGPRAIEHALEDEIHHAAAAAGDDDVPRQAAVAAHEQQRRDSECDDDQADWSAEMRERHKENSGRSGAHARGPSIDRLIDVEHERTLLPKQHRQLDEVLADQDRGRDAENEDRDGRQIGVQNSHALAAAFPRAREP
jgi:hypothetical protein